MQKESAESPELKTWYENRMGQFKDIPIMKFFNDRRVHTIHKGVVKPGKCEERVWDVKVSGAPIQGEGTMTFWRFDGVEEFIPGSSGGVFRLCEQYFIILRGLVAEWMRKRKELGIA